MLKKGDSGPEVRSLQQNLLITPDGVFGKQTEKHVIRFQLMHNLAADGIVGSDTLPSTIAEVEKDLPQLMSSINALNLNFEKSWQSLKIL